jgi:hypothetical protein
MRSRTCCLARSIHRGSCSGWAVSWSTPPSRASSREEPFVYVLGNRLVAPGTGSRTAGSSACMLMDMIRGHEPTTPEISWAHARQPGRGSPGGRSP